MSADQNWVNAVAFSSDGRLPASAGTAGTDGTDGTVRLWDATGTERKTVKLGLRVLLPTARGCPPPEVLRDTLYGWAFNTRAAPAGPLPRSG